jgi:hypothetical protein
MEFPNSVIPDMLQPSSLLPEPLPTLPEGSGILDIVNGPTASFGSSQPYDPVKALNFNKPASSTAMAAPLTFDPVGTRLDRYTNSQYFGQLGFNPLEGYGNEYKYGAVQSWGDVWGNALGGAWKLASDTYVEGWKGWGKLAEAIGTWDSSKLIGTPEELLEQSKLHESIMNKYAIFATPESDSGELLNRKFFGDMVQQAGFALGTIGQFVTEELITLGLSTEFSLAKLGLSAPKWLGRTVTKADVVADMAKSGHVLARSDNFVNSLVNGAKKFVPLVGTVDDIARYNRAGAGALQLAAIGAGGVRRMLGEANMAFTEARMEAAGTYGELYNHLFDEELRRTGEMPSGEKIARMKELSYDAATDNFGVNAGILMLSNRLQFDNLFTKFDFGRRVLGESAGYANDVLTVAGKNLTKTYAKGRLGGLGLYGDIAKDFGRRTAAWEAAKSVGSNVFKWEAVEGLQEILQEGSNLTLQKYYYDLYHGAKGGEFSNYIKSAASDLGQNNQGLKTFLMGALTGRLISPINFAIGQAKMYAGTTAEQREQRKTDIKETVDLINGFYQNPNKFMNEHIANVKIQNKVATTMDEAIANRDQYVFTNAKDSGFARTVSAAIKTNMFEPLMETMKTFADKMDAKEFKEAFGMEMTEDNVSSVKEFFGKVADSAKEFHKNWKSLKDRYSDLVIPELYKQGTPERNIAAYAKKALDESIEIMATLDFKSKKAIERAVELQSQMAAIPNIGSSVEIAFRNLGDMQSASSEAMLLRQELAQLEDMEKPDAATKRLIKAKQQQIAALDKWIEGYVLLTAEDKDIRSLFKKREFNKAFRDYVNSKNSEKDQKEVVVKQTDFTKVYDTFLDHMQLYKDHYNYIDAFNVIANPTQFISLHDRIVDAITKAGEKFNEEHVAEARVMEEEGGDLSKLLNEATEDESATIDTPEGEEIQKAEVLNIEGLQDDLELLYKKYVADLEEAGQKPADPTSFLRFNNEASKVLAKYGVSYKEVYSVESETDPGDVKFVYGKKPEKVTPEEDVQVTPTDAETEGAVPADTDVSMTVGGFTLNLGDTIQDGVNPDIQIIGFTSKGEVTVVTQDQTVDVPKERIQEVLNNGYAKLVKNPNKGQLPASETNRRDLKTNPRKKFVNGEVVNVSKTRGTTLDQANSKNGIDADIEKKSQSLVQNKKVINGYQKVNNTFFNTRTKTDPGKDTLLTKEGINKNYPLVMATSKIAEGTPLLLRVDTGMTSFDEYDYLNSDVKAKKSRKDYFDKNDKILPEAESDFPVAIYTVVDGKEIKLGYLPTERWVSQTLQNGDSKNIVDEIFVDDAVIDNRAININMIRKIRKEMMDKFNNQNVVEQVAVVSGKSDGTLMTDSKLRKLSEVFHPNTQLSIIKNGVPYVGLNQPLTEDEENLILPSMVSETFANKESLNGWPMVTILTPSGKKLVSWVSVPTLNAGHQDLILEAWKSFHKLLTDNKASKKYDTKSEQYKIANAIYSTYGSKLELDEAPDFKILQNYINDYITFTSSEMKYNPLKPNTSQINVLPDGTLITWAVETQKEDQDKLILKSPSQLTQDNQDKYYNLAALVYYNVKFTDKNNTGINSDKKMSFLSVVGGKLVKSQPMTYNEHIFNILETNVAPGIPVDPSNPNSEFVHFANPVINFEFTGEERKAAPTKAAVLQPNVSPLAQVQGTARTEPVVTAAPVSTDAKKGFQGYKGGFENTGKGTVQGDGKDKAMRNVANSAIVELASNKDSSSKTSLGQLGLPKEGDKVIMLARNGSLSGKALKAETKEQIRQANLDGVEFIVGDMPGVDSQFIDYLQEIGAKFTIYHTGATSRITIAASEGAKPAETESLADMLLGADFGEGITDFGDFDPGLLDDLEGNKKSIATRVDNARQDKQISKEC